jgi:prevent-host-death family protein
MVFGLEGGELDAHAALGGDETSYPSPIRPNDHYYGHMAKSMTATTAKASFLRLLDETAAGEEIEITRHGRPVARLVPPVGTGSLEGLFKGRAMTAVGDEEDLFSTGEVWNAS